jgi:hypothetical protein
VQPVYNYASAYVLQLVKVRFNLLYGCLLLVCISSVNFGDITEALFGASVFQGAKVRGSSPQLTVTLCSDILGDKYKIFKKISALYGIGFVSAAFNKPAIRIQGGSLLRLHPRIHSFNTCRVRRRSTITDMPSMTPRQVSSTTGGNTGMGST